VLEALKERRTISEMAEQFHLHPNQINKWKKDGWELARQKGSHKQFKHPV